LTTISNQPKKIEKLVAPPDKMSRLELTNAIIRSSAKSFIHLV